MSHQIKRSQKSADFATGMPLMSRERSFVRPNRDYQKRRSQTMATIKGKPTLEIYRPPNVRTDLPNGQGKLNVHAKEFTMNDHELQPSKSSGNLNMAMNYEHFVPLQQSKSSGNILRHANHHGLVRLIPGIPLPALVHSSSPQIVGKPQPQAYHQYPQDMLVFSGLNQALNHHQQANFLQGNHKQTGTNQTGSLKRSKSLGTTESKNIAHKLKGIAKEDINLDMFSVEDRTNLKLALEDPGQLQTRTLMDLVKVVMEKVVEGIKYCETIAKLCVSIIDNEKNQTFLESLLNTCQQWYQDRDKILRGIKSGEGTRFTAFMWFLTELCSQIKRHQLAEQFDSLQPDLILLSVLAKCCQACVSLPIKCLSETECLFFVLTSIGKDLESELPQQLEQLLASVRDGFLASAGSASVRRTLLQLIELHASNWQLPGSSVLYYYPRIK